MHIAILGALKQRLKKRKKMYSSNQIPRQELRIGEISMLSSKILLKCYVNLGLRDPR